MKPAVLLVAARKREAIFPAMLTLESVGLELVGHVPLAQSVL
jgi:hypothetical protein